MKVVFTLFCLTFSVENLFSQDTIRYSVSFPNAVHHEAEITISISGIQKNDSLFFRMSSSSPGRYAPHQFAKNIYHLHAFDEEKRPLSIIRLTPERWMINAKGETINLSYTLFADHPDGTYSGIDRNFAILNMPSTLLWLESGERSPVIIKFKVPENKAWKIATQLKNTSSPYRFQAPDLPYLMDSPVVLGDFITDTLRWEENINSGQEIRIIYHPPVDRNTIDIYSEMIRKVVREQQSVFGELPEYDYGFYVFQNNYGPGFFGDGMEHRNSTVITSPLPLPGNEKRLIGTVAHEFFHCWNVERIRPESLEPFDFTRPNMSGELWFAEGFTSYYSALTCYRAGIYTMDDLLTEFSQTLNYVINTPGRKAGSPVHMSRMATFVDAAEWIDEMNINQVFISYYQYGMAIGLALDLSLRSLDRKVTLDDLMRYMWQEYGIKEIPYTMEDLKEGLATVSGSSRFANQFFDNYIQRNQLPDFAELFLKAGFQMKQAHPGAPWLGFSYFDYKDGNALLLNYPFEDDPLYKAGIGKGDRIIRLDSVSLNTQPVLDNILRVHHPGDTLKAEYLHLNTPQHSKIVLQEDPTLLIEPVSRPEKKQLDFRDAWLSSRVIE